MGLTLFHEIFLTFVLYVIYPKLMVWDQTHGFMCFTLWKPLINMCVPFVPFARVMEKRVKVESRYDHKYRIGCRGFHKAEDRLN
jgi:hypothetical protein